MQLDCGWGTLDKGAPWRTARVTRGLRRRILREHALSAAEPFVLPVLGVGAVRRGRRRGPRAQRLQRGGQLPCDHYATVSSISTFR